MALCVAVIGKDNSPLFLETTRPTLELRFLHTVHTALDVVEEKMNAGSKEAYLGMLYPQEDFKVYGYVTNTRIKFVIVVDSSNASVKDNEVKTMFRKLHASYVDMFCNPFYTPGTSITSKSFQQLVSTLFAPET